MSITETQSPDGRSQDHHDKEITIIVNGQVKKVMSSVVSFAQVVALAFPTPPSDKTIFLVVYRNAADHKKGTLTVGETVTVKDGTIFDVTPTDKS